MSVLGLNISCRIVTGWKPMILVKRGNRVVFGIPEKIIIPILAVVLTSTAVLCVLRVLREVIEILKELHAIT